jgi:indole-3-glycerol phosphate synthase
LRTFEVDLETSLRLRPRIPQSCLVVSESGICNAADLSRLEEAGFDAALIGERLVTQPDPGRALSELLGRTASVESRARDQQQVS